MPKHPKQEQAQTEVPTLEVPESKVDLRESFVDLVAERFGYSLARRLIVKDAGEKTQAERKKVTEASKAVTESIEALIKAPNEAKSRTVTEKREALKDARKVASEARKPFIEKAKPLAAAVKYCDNVAIPDSLKELGLAVAPRFKLSEWAQKAVEQTKRKD